MQLVFYYLRFSFREIGIYLTSQSEPIHIPHYLDEKVSNFERSNFFSDLNTANARLHKWRYVIQINY